MVNPNERILEARANKFRDTIGLGSADPVDLYKLLSDQNVIATFRPMKEDFSGMAFKTGNERFMLINTRQPLGRQHFTIGHELYHLCIQEVFTFRLCKTGLFDKKDKEEYNADVFSSYFLMPEAGILSHIPEAELARGGQISLPTIIKLEQYFGVSRKAMLVRLGKLDLIHYPSYEQYLTGVAKSANVLGYPVDLYKKENTAFEGKVIGDYGTLTKKLFEKEVISESHYFNLMLDIGINIDENFDEDEGESG